MKILLVEDDDTFVKVLIRTLKPYHYMIDTVRDGEMGWTYGSTFEYDLIVLDVVLPKLDGISLCQRFRSQGYETPILLLTSQDANTAKVQGLDAGADDYVVKPFDPAELVARIRALLRRGRTTASPLLTCGDLRLNPNTGEVSYQGHPLTLTKKEYDLLELMMGDRQHVFSTEELLDHLWTSEEFPSEATVRSHIRRVRQKLVSVGAPSDFIATLHGRGYYLKAIRLEAEEELTTPLQEHTKAAAIHFDSAHLAIPDPQAYIDFLNLTWTTTKPDSLDQTTVLLQIIRDLQGDQMRPQQQRQAQQVAHKLAGTLSIFGLRKAVHLARQLESWFGSQDALQPVQAPLIQKLVEALNQEIQATTRIDPSQLPHTPSPCLFLLGVDAEWHQSLESIAARRGIQLESLPVLSVDETLRAIAAKMALSHQSLHGILVQLPSTPSAEALLPLDIVQTCTQQYPYLLTMVMGDASALGDRLEVMRHGGKLFLDRSTPPEQVLNLMFDHGHGSNETKVMIVDDDHLWLQTLPTLLKPWGFQVTTLAEPQQFWTVLQAITPDVVVLDINMPDINGFELCQILRSDPQWQRLPVLFLSVLTDTASQQHAFTVGADDYLCKPLMGGELANRIMNRLQRVRSWIK